MHATGAPPGERPGRTGRPAGVDASRRASDSLADAFEGEVIDGSLRVIAWVGSGATGSVYRAEELGTGRSVAIKVLSSRAAQDDALVSRLDREAAIGRELEDPHVVRVDRIGRWRTPGGDERPYLVMEWLDGRTLRDAIDAEPGPFAVDRALHIARQLARALGAAHAAGVVHRDVKPENIHLVCHADDPEFVRLLDFGVARRLTSVDDVTTRAGALFGTPRYMAPELYRGDPATPRSDVYSLGIVLYELLSGRRPFDGDGLELVMAHAEATPPDLRTVSPPGSVPESVIGLVERALAKDPLLRPPDGGAFRQELDRAVARGGLAVGDRASSTPPITGGPARELGSGTLVLEHPGAVHPSPAVVSAGPTPAHALDRTVRLAVEPSAPNDGAQAARPGPATVASEPYDAAMGARLSVTAPLTHLSDESGPMERRGDTVLGDPSDARPGATIPDDELAVTRQLPPRGVSQPAGVPPLSHTVVLAPTAAPRHGARRRQLAVAAAFAAGVALALGVAILSGALGSVDGYDAALSGVRHARSAELWLPSGGSSAPERLRAALDRFGSRPELELERRALVRELVAVALHTAERDRSGARELIAVALALSPEDPAALALSARLEEPVVVAVDTAVGAGDASPAATPSAAGAATAPAPSAGRADAPPPPSLEAPAPPPPPVAPTATAPRPTEPKPPATAPAGGTTTAPRPAEPKPPATAPAGGTSTAPGPAKPPPEEGGRWL